MKEDEYVKLTNQIIERQEQIITLRRQLNNSNKTFQETKEVQLQPWQYKNITEEIVIKEKEIEMFKEKRSLLKR